MIVCGGGLYYRYIINYHVIGWSRKIIHNLRWLIVATIGRWSIIQGLLTTFRCRRRIIRRHVDDRKKTRSEILQKLFLFFTLLYVQCLCTSFRSMEALVVIHHPIYRVGAPLFREDVRQSPSIKAWHRATQTSISLSLL